MTAEEIRGQIDACKSKPYKRDLKFSSVISRWEIAYQLATLNEREAAQLALKDKSSKEMFADFKRRSDEFQGKNVRDKISVKVSFDNELWLALMDPLDQVADLLNAISKESGSGAAKLILWDGSGNAIDYHTDIGLLALQPGPIVVTREARTT